MSRKFLSSQLRINMATGVAATAMNTIILAVGYPIYLHYLDYELYGVWLILSTVLALARLGNLGIGQAVMKLVAEEYGQKNIKSVQQYIAAAFTMISFSGFIVLVLLIFLKKPVTAIFRLSGENSDVFSGLLPYIGVLSIFAFIVDVLQGALSGLGRMDITNYIQVAGRTLQVLVACSLLAFGIGIKSMLIGYIVSYLFIYVSLLYFIKQKISVRIFNIRNLEIKKCKKLLYFGGNVVASSLVSMLFNPFNKLMLSRYGGVALVPVYEIAFNGSMQIRSLIEVGFRALVPEISRISTELKNEATNRIIMIYHRSMKIIFLFGIPVYASFAIFAPVLLKFWLRDKYLDIMPGIFRLMLIGTSFISLVGALPYYVIMGCGRVQSLLTASTIGSGSNILLVTLTIFLTTYLSLYNVALCSGIANSIALGYLIWRAHKLFERKSALIRT